MLCSGLVQVQPGETYRHEHSALVWCRVVTHVARLPNSLHYCSSFIPSTFARYLPSPIASLLHVRRGRSIPRQQRDGAHRGRRHPEPRAGRGGRRREPPEGRAGVGHGRAGADRDPRPADRRAARRGTPRLCRALQGVAPRPSPLRALRRLPERHGAVDDGPGGAGRASGQRRARRRQEDHRRPARLGAGRGRLRLRTGPPRRRPPRVPLPLRLLPRGGRRRLPGAPGPAWEAAGEPGEVVPLRDGARRRRRRGARGGAAGRGHQEEEAAARRRGDTDRQHEEQAPAAGHVPAVRARPRRRHRRGHRQA